MKDNVIRMAICPLCGRTYHGVPALSREDNETLICPDCGTRQALQSIGVEDVYKRQAQGSADADRLEVQHGTDHLWLEKGWKAQVVWRPRCV